MIRKIFSWKNSYMMKQSRHKKFGLRVTRECPLGNPGLIISRHANRQRATQRYWSWYAGGWDDCLEVVELNKDTREEI